jgi:hypothetical protein
MSKVLFDKYKLPEIAQHLNKLLTKDFLKYKTMKPCLTGNKSGVTSNNAQVPMHFPI